jgi:hypothetical protein
MTDDEIALRAAINVLRDSIESRRMPSGLPLSCASDQVHRRAVESLEIMIDRLPTQLQP